MNEITKLNGYEIKDATARSNHDALVGEIDNLVEEVEQALANLETLINEKDYSLPLATSSELGGVKIGYAENGKNYPVELNGVGQMYVNVPWENTTYTLSSFGVTATSADLNLLTGINNRASTNIVTSDKETELILNQSVNSASKILALVENSSGGTSIKTINPALMEVKYASSAGAVAWGNITGTPTFATVATSGKYSDLIGIPTIPSAVTFTQSLTKGIEIGAIKIGNTSTTLYAPDGYDLTESQVISALGYTPASEDLTNEALALARGAITAVSFANFDLMAEELRDPESIYGYYGSRPLNVGSILYLKQKDVPDYWVSAVHEYMDEPTGEKTFKLTAKKLNDEDDGSGVPYSFDDEIAMDENGDQLSIEVTLSDGDVENYDLVYQGTLTLSNSVRPFYYIRVGDNRVSSPIVVDGVELDNDGIYLVKYDYDYPSNTRLGYYEISELEGRKVILTDYAKIADITSGLIVAKKAKNAEKASDSDKLNGQNSAYYLNYNNFTNTPIIPTRTSQITNDSGFLTSYTETDPTVPAWAKAANKPTYDYSEIKNTPTPYSLPNATNATLGGVKIGSNISASNGVISLTKDNVTSALGYTPPTTNTTYSQATSSALGLVKIGYSPSGKNYAVELDSSGKMFVNVPWTIGDTVSVTQKLTSGTEIGSVTVGSTTTKLYAPTATSVDLSNYSTLANTIKSLSISGKTITYTKGDGTTGTLTTQDTTYTLPLSASGTRGGIQIGYSESGANLALKLSGEKGYVALTKTAVTSALGYTPPTSDTTYSNATTSANGLMSATDKSKLDGIAEGANNYSLPTAGSTLGGVKTTSTVASTSGYTACPIIGGVPYYKNTVTYIHRATVTLTFSAGSIPVKFEFSLKTNIQQFSSYAELASWLDSNGYTYTTNDVKALPVLTTGLKQMSGYYIVIQGLYNVSGTIYANYVGYNSNWQPSIGGGQAVSGITISYEKV